MKVVKNIGIFDSGAGGLSVLKSILAQLRFENIVYYGDNARVPYGNKDSDIIIKYSLEALEFFNNFDIDLLIIACNTSSAYAIEDLRKYASFPVIGVIESGVRAVQLKSQKDDNILIVSTSATKKSCIYENELRKIGFNNLYSIGANLLVSLVEENITNNHLIHEVFSHYFYDLHTKVKINSVILGCTHFPLLIDNFRAYFGENCTFIHSGEAIVEFLKKHFILSGSGNNKLEIYASANANSLKNTAKRWLS